MPKKDVKEYFDKIADKRDKWRARSSYYHDDIKSLMRFIVPAEASVLEIGTATGDVLAHLKPTRGLGVDISEGMIGIARKKYPDLRFEVADAENIKIDEKFDYILLSDMISFFDDIQGVFKELHKVSDHGSRIVITYYNYLWEPVMALAEKIGLKMPQPVQNWITKHDVENLLYLSGFEIVKTGQRLLIPKYIPVLSWLFNKYLAKMPLIKRLCLVNYCVARQRAEKYSSTIAPESVSVVIPARNEKGNIEDAVKRVPNMGSHTEIIFVEGNSTDDTLEEMKRVQAAYPDKDIKVFVQEGKGKGDAVRKGFKNATGDILMILDADLTVRPEELPKFYEALNQSAGEFINGSRLVYQLEDDSMRFLNILGNKFFSSMFSWLLDQEIKDTLCGTKVLRRTEYEKIIKGRSFFGDFDPFGDFDLLFGAAKLNLKIVDLPIRYQARVYGETNISRFRHGWILLKMCFFAMKKIKFI
ncbi:glycosyltransferase [Candidatus Falkowbacteria bacterium]|nr:glycosyltransferase [Candidatus Falkowbacteria bacterium]